MFRFLAVLGQKSCFVRRMVLRSWPLAWPPLLPTPALSLIVRGLVCTCADTPDHMLQLSCHPCVPAQHTFTSCCALLACSGPGSRRRAVQEGNPSVPGTWRMLAGGQGSSMFPNLLGLWPRAESTPAEAEKGVIGVRAQGRDPSSQALKSM